MNIRIVKARGHRYAQLVNIYREGKKVKTDLIASLGKVGEDNTLIDSNNLSKLADQLKILTGEVTREDLAHMDSQDDVTILNYGHKIYENIFNELKLPSVLNVISENHPKLKIDLVNTSLLMIIQRLLEPMSKIKTFENQDYYYDLKKIEEEQHLYRALDYLADNKDLIEQHLYKQNFRNEVLDVVFYDVTTYAFESVRADDLKDFGYSKDKKFNEVQVVMGLLLGSNGIPAGYDLFSGNTSEVKTMKDIIEKLREKYKIGKIIITADSGLNTKGNLLIIKQAGYDYIVASRIKNLNTTMTNKMFDEEGYIQTSNPNNQEGLFKSKKCDYTNIVKIKDETTGKINTHKLEEKMIFSYSESRARKNRKDRERLVEKARNLSKNPEKVEALNKRGGKKYLSRITTGEITYEVNEIAIEEDEKYDGYYGIQTSCDLTAEEILTSYHQLWKIEQSFRILKSTLDARPIYHWTEKRIKGHFVICYVALDIQRVLEYKLDQDKNHMTTDEIIQAINDIRLVETNISNLKIYKNVKATEVMAKLKGSIDIRMNNRNKIVVQHLS